MPHNKMNLIDKQAKKERQEYESKPEFPMCGSCIHFAFDFEYVGSALSNKMTRKETKLRCGLGGFSVRKEATCKMHKPKHHPAN
jgi:hypothetical protein